MDMYKIFMHSHQQLCTLLSPVLGQQWLYLVGSLNVGFPRSNLFHCHLSTYLWTQLSFPFPRNVTTSQATHSVLLVPWSLRYTLLGVHDLCLVGLALLFSSLLPILLHITGCFCYLQQSFAKQCLRCSS